MRQPYIPIIDISPLYSADQQDWQSVAQQIDQACRNSGFFYVVGHAITAQRIDELESMYKRFFALPMAEKLKNRYHKNYASSRLWQHWY